MGTELAPPSFMIRPPRDLISGTTLSLRSLPGESFAAGCLVFVQENKSYYIWDSTSVEADNPPNVVVPNVTVGGKGRWVLLATGGGPDTPNLEAEVSTVAGETITALTIPIAANEGISAGIRWFGTDGAGNTIFHELTFVAKRIGAAAAIEVGVHDNGEIRDNIDVALAGADSDYVMAATGVDLIVTGVVGTPLDWIVQAWFTTYPL